MIVCSASNVTSRIGSISVVYRRQGDDALKKK